MTYFVREISRDDLIAINQWRNNRELVVSLTSSFRYINLEVDDAWFSSYMVNRNNAVRLAIAQKSTNLIVGAVYLLKIDWIVRSAEFSIWIGEKEHQGKGVGKFATHSLLSHAFNDLGLNRIYLTLLPGNERARRLYASLGFKDEGVQRQAAFKSGKYVDLNQMSMLASDFLNLPPVSE